VLKFYNTSLAYNSRTILEKKLADAEVSEEDQNNLLKFLEKKETEYMRLQRAKMGVDDFELLTMIGKGAFGEVCLQLYVMSNEKYDMVDYAFFWFMVIFFYV